jgi:hypothetical protein
MDAATRRLVQQRAGNACEYCGLTQDDEPFASFHVEHIIARQHGGGDEPGNLCWACTNCNLHKGPNIAGIDPQTGVVVPLFHPRQQIWDEHFQWNGAQLLGRTAVGRATIAVLAINLPENIELRETLTAERIRRSS